MKSLRIFTILTFVMLAFAISTSAQVTVSGSTGADGTYATLGAAFTAINGAGTQAGNDILVEVSANTTETATASLNASDWTTLTVRPSVAGVIVEGTITGAIIRLNGADNVTIDGRLNGIGTTNRDMTVRNNSTSVSTAAVWLSSNGVGAGATNNVVRNLEIRCGATQNTSANSTFGIIMSGNTISTSSNGDDNDNNQFIFNRIMRVRYGITTRGVPTNLNIAPIVTDNIIGPTSFGADQIGKVGIFMQADTGAVVSRNTVQYVGGDFANTTSGADRVGIGIGQESWSMSPSTLTSNTYTVTRNVISNVVEERTFSAIGLLLGTTGGGSATNNLVANNFIINVKANGTVGDHAVGLGISGGHTDTVVNNSISMFGDCDPNPSATATTNHSSGIRIANNSGTTHLNLTLSNNSVYMDLSSSSTAGVRFYAISGPINTYSFGTGGENFNNLYINPANLQLLTGGLGTNSGNTLTTGFATLANWQTAYTVPQDANSIQVDPQYSSISSDLHLIGTSPNINTGVTLAITDDIDGQARPNGASYDIGADEFYPAPGVLQLSSTTYGGNEGTSVNLTVNRVSGSSGVVTVDVNLANISATGGTACGGSVDYAHPSFPGPITLTFPDSVTSQNLSVTLCTDSVNDPAETFTATLSNPTGGATLGSPTTATVTITDVPPPFSGTYTVGTSGTYPSLTNPGGIFEAINLAGTSGAVTIEIVSDLTGETGANALNEHTNPILIKPSGAPRTITGSSTTAIIRLNGADNVRIDGSTAASLVDDFKQDGNTDSLVGGNPALRELTIENTNTSTSSGVILVGTGTNGAQNNTLRNLNVDGNAPTTTLVAISLGGNTVGTAGADNDNNTVRNCRVRRAVFGIYSAGISLANQNTGTRIEENQLDATTTDRIGRVGIFLFNDDGALVVENSVGGITSSAGADSVGIGLGVGASDGQFSNSATTSGGITNAVVTRNRINGVQNDNTWGAAGIAVAGDTAGPNTISNNLITGVISDATSPDIVAGIFVAGVIGSNTRLYYNSISMTGDRSALTTPATGQQPSYGIAITGTDPTVELINNVLYTTQTADTAANPNARSFAIGMFSGAFVNLNSNFNDFWSTGPQDGGFRTGSLAAASGTDHVDLAAWQAAVSDDANSLEVDPLFLNPLNDLHLQATSPVRNVGSPIGGITVDHDNQNRPNPFDSLVVEVDMGGDEFYGPLAAEASITGRVIAADGTGIRNAVIVVTGGNLTQPRLIRTGPFGYYSVEGLEVGQTYVLTIQSKRFTFANPTRVVSLQDNIEDLDFVANE